MPNKPYDFVITDGFELEGNYIDFQFRIGKKHYYLSGEASEVRGAGSIIINENGKVTAINPFSGHYKPSDEHNEKVIQLFKDLNLWKD